MRRSSKYHTTLVLFFVITMTYVKARALSLRERVREARVREIWSEMFGISPSPGLRPPSPGGRGRSPYTCDRNCEPQYLVLHFEVRVTNVRNHRGTETQRQSGTQSRSFLPRVPLCLCVSVPPWFLTYLTVFAKT